MVFKQWLLEMVFFLIELIERVVLESLFLESRGGQWFIERSAGL
jgi:hypothetical protein